jgi:hypothetical protein
MDEDQRGSITDFADNLLNFSTPTHTYESSNHSDGYFHLKIAIAQCFSRAAKNWFCSTY